MSGDVGAAVYSENTHLIHLLTQLLQVHGAAPVFQAPCVGLVAKVHVGMLGGGGQTW